MGYLYESIAIKARAARCASAWKPHLEATKQFLLSSAAACAQKRTAVIFGSGWLLDVPLQELASEFEEVHLVDILHPAAARRAARKHRNVQLVSLDLSGVINSVHQLTSRVEKTHRKESLPFPQRPFLSSSERVDFVASVNVLSQLPQNPVNALRALKDPSGTPVYSDGELDAYAASLRDAHLKFLHRFPHACLVSDVEMQTWRADTCVHQKDLVTEWKSLPSGREWSWEIAPPGEITPGERTCHRVIACQLTQI